MKNAPELSTASAGEAIQVLRAHAEGHMHHLNRGVCPDEIAGHDSRDADCNALKTLAASPAPGRAPLTDEQIAVLQFLYGLGNLDGCGFGDRPHGERGMYWWRKHLRAAFPGIAPAGGIGGE